MTVRPRTFLVSMASVGALALMCAPSATAASADDLGNSIRTAPYTSTGETLISPTATYNGNKYLGAQCPYSTSGYATWNVGAVTSTTIYVKTVTFKATSGTFSPYSIYFTDNQGKNVPYTSGSPSSTTATYTLNRTVAFGTQGVKLSQSVNAPGRCSVLPQLNFRVVRP